jgi:hypothetical protein
MAGIWDFFGAGQREKPMGISDVPFFGRPAFATDNDTIIGMDELSNPVYLTPSGRKYTVSINPNPTKDIYETINTTSGNLLEAVPAVADWIVNTPRDEKRDTIGKGATALGQGIIDYANMLGRGEGTMEDAFSMAFGVGAPGFARSGVLDYNPNTLGSTGGNIRLRPQTDAPFDMGGGIGGNGGPVFSLLDATANLPPHSRPEWSGAAENRTTPYPRYEPLRGAPERMQRLTAMLDDPTNPIHDKVRGYVSRGQGLGGEDWYNTEELRAWFVDELGEKTGDARWREYVNAVGHTSTGSSVPSNLRNASLYYMLDPADRLRVADMVKNTPRTTPRMAVEALGIDVPNMPVKYGYGHKMQGTQAGNVANAERGLWDRDAADGLTGAALTEQLSANSKVKGFLNDLLGDDTNIAADKHFMRVMAMADGGVDFLSGQAELSAANREMLRLRYGDALDAYTSTRTKDGKTFTNVNLSKAAKDGVITDTAAFSEMPTAWEDMPKATEYKALENVAQRLAAAQGITPAQFQANLWMGAGDVTGLADESQGTFMELFRRTADKRAAERGVSRTDQIRDFINKGAPMAIGGGGLLSTMMPQEEQH